MAAYMILNIEIADPEVFKDFQEKFPPVLEKYGGRYLTRGGKAERWEGEWEPKRIVILEFPSKEQQGGYMIPRNTNHSRNSGINPVNQI